MPKHSAILSSHLPTSPRRFGRLLLVTVFIASAAIAEEPTDSERKTNRLAQETSPYLLQHAHNPVDWYPWGEEALERAKREKKIIFLSVGYSSCHWCHVMERESFMDEEIATFMNEHFVCIKVDREERPDIDAIYMKGLQVFYELAGAGQGGGWPLSMFLTPDGEPFFGGTYFPPRDGDRGAATGFFTLIQRIQETWKDKEELVRRDAKTITGVLKRQLEKPLLPLGREFDAKLLDEVQAALASQFDAQHGGFGFDPDNDQQPKFPEPANLFFLIERCRGASKVGNTGEQDPLTMLTVTLDHLARGGIYDHLGGGFHRYSVDRYWSIPHFEKMLYDNGQLISVYAEAYALTKRGDFRRAVEQSIEFAKRELMDAEIGCFYSALDADSEGEEGKFYRWSGSELRQIVGEDQWQPFASVYQLDGAPNFDRQFYVPQVERPWADLARDLGTDEETLVAQLAPIRAKLLEQRNQRARPATDTKILTAWNGLMIRGLADAGRLLDKPEYIEMAKVCAVFLLEEVRAEDGRLHCTYSQGQARLNGYLNDYAFLIDGLIAVHRATGEARWLESAQQLMDKQIELFWDDTANGFFFTSDDHETLLARTKEFIDNVTPSGNSVSATNLLYLSEQLGHEEYREKAEQTMQAALPYFERAPGVAPWMAIAVSRSLQPKNP